MAINLMYAPVARPSQPEQTPEADQLMGQSCVAPAQSGDIPDGRIATEAQMLLAQAAVRHFDASITMYTACLAEAELRLAAQHPDMSDELAIARVERNNAAVQRAEQSTAEFNLSLADFRKRGYQPATLHKSAMSSDQSFCDPYGRRKATIDVDLRLSEAGEVLEIDLPVGLSRELQIIARCLIRRMTFDPARRDGIAESGSLALQIHLGDRDVASVRDGGQVVLATSSTEMAAAHDDCLPAELQRSGEVGLLVTVGPNGQVIRVSTAVGSGSREVDLVATCVAQTLRYQPSDPSRSVPEGYVVPVVIKVTAPARK